MRIRSPLGCVALAAGIVAGVAPAGAVGSTATPPSIREDGGRGSRLLWESRYLKGNIPVGVAVSPDGSRVYLTGSDCSGNLCQEHQDYSTVAYDAATGDSLWATRFDGPGHSLDESHSIAISPDGAEIYVTGGSVNVDLIMDFATIAYDAATGDQVWEARYRGPGEGAGADYGRRIAVDPSGATVYVTGPAKGVGSGKDYTTLAYEASTGDQRWVAVYDGPTLEDDIPQALMVSPDGNTVYVTGGGVGSVYDDFATVAYDAATGDQLWVDRYGSGGLETDLAVGLGVSPDSSRLYVAGCSGGDTGCFGDSHWTTIAYDASGQRIWLKKFDGSAQGKDIVEGLRVSLDGSLVYVAGASGPDGDFDFAIVAYDSATGQPQWKGRYAGDEGGDDIAYALAVAPDGSEVVVTGVSDGLPQAGDVTVAFDGTTGKPLWSGRHPGEGAVAVEFSPDSATVFVAGSLYRDGYAYDTLAYGA